MEDSIARLKTHVWAKLDSGGMRGHNRREDDRDILFPHTFSPLDQCLRTSGERRLGQNFHREGKGSKGPCSIVQEHSRTSFCRGGTRWLHPGGERDRHKRTSLSVHRGEDHDGGWTLEDVVELKKQDLQSHVPLKGETVKKCITGATENLRYE